MKDTQSLQESLQDTAIYRKVPVGTVEKTCPACGQKLPLDRACCSGCGHWFRTYFVVADPVALDTINAGAAGAFSRWSVLGGVLLTLAALLLSGLAAGVAERHSPVHQWVTRAYASALHTSS